MFLIAVFSMKFIVIHLIASLTFLTSLLHPILDPYEGSRTQIVVVLFIFPLVMNVIQAWLTDRVIKAETVVFVAQEIEEGEDIELIRNKRTWMETVIGFMFKRDRGQYSRLDE